MSDDKHILSELSVGNSVQSLVTGNSMFPILKEGDVYLITPLKEYELKVGDIVFVNIKNKFLTHMILDIQDNTFTISNIKRKIDGVVTINSIYGIIKTIKYKNKIQIQ
jgi:hypothetical protein